MVIFDRDTVRLIATALAVSPLVVAADVLEMPPLVGLILVIGSVVAVHVRVVERRFGLVPADLAIASTAAAVIFLASPDMIGVLGAILFMLMALVVPSGNDRKVRVMDVIMALALGAFAVASAEPGWDDVVRSGPWYAGFLAQAAVVPVWLFPAMAVMTEEAERAGSCPLCAAIRLVLLIPFLLVLAWLSVFVITQAIAAIAEAIAGISVLLGDAVLVSGWILVHAAAAMAVMGLLDSSMADLIAARGRSPRR